MSERRARTALASGIAIVCAVYTWVQHGYFITHGAAPDSLYLWRAAQLVTHGLDPWSPAVWNAAASLVGAHETAWTVRLVDPLYYPMPAVLLWIPLSVLPFLVATTVFNSIGAFLFVYAVTRDGLHRAWLCGSMPFVFAMRFGQWSPLIAAAFVLPALAAVLVAKPNLGLPVFLSAPSITAASACAVLLVVPTLIAPWWVREWIANISADLGRTAPHPAPVTMFGGAGVLAAIALLRWRRADARLLVALACVPQLPYWSDQLPLMLVASTRREVIGMVLVTLLGFTAWMLVAPGRGDHVDTMRPVAILCTYAPAMLLILRRAN